MSADPPDLPRSLHQLAANVARHGGRAFLVGGGVRDHLMQLAVKDWDVEVFGIPGAQLQRILRSGGSVNTVGRSFGVYKWRPRGSAHETEIDVSIPRRDSKVGPGHRGIHVEGDPDMTLAEAAQRRDLTINALMWDIADQRLEDPASGLDDLERRVLRAVDSETFLEDPLRALRVVQFAARLDFTVDPSLLELCRRAALDELPAERVQAEWGKLLLKGQRPSIGFAVARGGKILERVFPEAATLNADDVLDRLAAGPRNALDHGSAWVLMLAGWLHGRADAVIPTLDRLWIHTVSGVPVRDRVVEAVAELDAPIHDDASLRHLSTRAQVCLVLPLQAAVHGIDVRDATARAKDLNVFTNKPKPLIGGRELKAMNVPPGPGMGVLLRQVYTAQLDGTVSDATQALALARTLNEGDGSSA